MTSTTYNLLKSRTFWLIVVNAFIQIGNAVVPTLSPTEQALVGFVLGMLAIYTHNQTAVTAGATN